MLLLLNTTRYRFKSIYDLLEFRYLIYAKTYGTIAVAVAPITYTSLDDHEFFTTGQENSVTIDSMYRNRTETLSMCVHVEGGHGNEHSQSVCEHVIIYIYIYMNMKNVICGECVKTKDEEEDEKMLALRFNSNLFIGGFFVVFSACTFIFTHSFISHHEMLPLRVKLQTCILYICDATYSRQQLLHMYNGFVSVCVRVCLC